MVKSIVSTLVVAVALANTPGASANPLGADAFNRENIPQELIDMAAEMSRSGTTSANELIESGEMDWLQSISATAELRNPLTDDADQPEAAEGDVAGSPEQPRPHPLGDGYKTFIFVSWSMGDLAIKGILDRYRGQRTTAIVFRGVPEDKTFAQGVMAVHALTMETESDLSVLIDPIAFKTHAITAVPSVAVESPEGETVIKASGTDSLARLQAALDDDISGDLGALGPTTEIIEPDLIEVAQERIENLDYDAMKSRAINRFWSQNTGTPLPTVTEDATRYVDPTVIVYEDILDAEGNVVTPRGEINPLDMMPFDQKLVIIDPSQDWQVALAADELRSSRQSITVTVMATQIAPDRGWELFESTEEAIEAPLYLLPQAMAQRFQIDKVPSVVTADTSRFIVTEYSKQSVEDRINGY